jgi:C4-dicarboxylate-specific signal transduction histidine kinase
MATISGGASADRPTFSLAAFIHSRAFRLAIANYAMASLFVVVALLLSLSLQRFFAYPFPFLFFAAVMAIAWMGGIGPGLFAVLVSILAMDYFFVPPLHSLALNATDAGYFAAFVVCALIASWVSSAKRADQEALRQARDQLEVRVAERTNELQHLNAELQKSIAQREKVQQAHIATQAELAHLSRFLTMGELTASIAHEVNQPLTAIVTFGNACLGWLSADPANLPEARQAAERIVADGTRAAGVLSRIRSAFQKQPPSKNWFDMNGAIEEIVALIRHEAARHHLTVQTELASNLPPVNGDRVQLQQVVLNLMMNAIDATHDAPNGRREILVRSQRDGAAAIRVIVEDHGVGITAEQIEKMFDPFFTTKPQGLGMGLSISRSIIESHLGRLSAVPRSSGGTIMHFTLPVGS